jgi:hypothetical protein
MRFWKPRKITGTPVVGIGVASYISDPDGREAAALKCLVASFQAQTYRHWRLDIVHDGPYSHDPATLKFFDQWDDDPRVQVIETAERKQSFGHPHRQATAERLMGYGAEWILHTNQDNYYAPVFLEWLLYEAQRHSSPFVYCDFVRSHKQWALHSSRPKKGHLDLGAFMAHKSIVTRVKFDRLTFEGDGDYINRLVAAARTKTVRVNAPLFVHN